MKRIITLLILAVTLCGLPAQNSQKADSRPANQNTVIRIEGSSQNGWIKGDNDTSSGPTTPVGGNENISFYGASEGIHVTINSGTYKIKLYALTGQLLFNSDFTQGRFIITARTGIYFLKINNKSYKVICK